MTKKEIQRIEKEYFSIIEDKNYSTQLLAAFAQEHTERLLREIYILREKLKIG
jgi:3-methyladenine DNA glycosylase Tag